MGCKLFGGFFAKKSKVAAEKVDESFAGIAQAGCAGRTSQDAARGVWVGLMSVCDPRDFRLLGGFDGGPGLNGKSILRERNRPC